MAPSRTPEEPEGAGRVYLVRHGRTTLNAEGVLRGRLDPSLDEVGLREARALAIAFAGLPVGLVVASPLRRALETAHPIARKVGIEPEVDPRLADRDYGQWAGTSKGEVEEKWGSLDAAPGVEPLESLRRRALEAFAALAARLSGPRAPLAVSHDIVNRTLIAALDPDRFPSAEAIPQRTGCYNVLERTSSGWRAVAVDVLPGC